MTKKTKLAVGIGALLLIAVVIGVAARNSGSDPTLGLLSVATWKSGALPSSQRATAIAVIDAASAATAIR